MQRQTTKQLREKAKEYHMCCYWKLRKGDLQKLVSDYELTGVIPQAFSAKKVRGEKCNVNEECRSHKCIESVCTGADQLNKKPPRVPKADLTPKPKTKVVKKKKVVPETPPAPPTPSPAVNKPKRKPPAKSNKRSPPPKPLPNLNMKKVQFNNTKKCVTKVVTICDK